MLPRLPDASVALVLCDLPYGVTDCRWDSKIDSAALWAQYLRVLRPRGAVVLFAQGAFAAELIGAAPEKWFRYEWVWDKEGCSGFLNATRLPMRAHELILVFGRKIRYFPQGLRRYSGRQGTRTKTDVYRVVHSKPTVQTRTGYPRTILRFAREHGAAPAQKPVALLEYLVRTYTRKGETVLDNAMGLGSTGVAAVNCGRRFVGMELDAKRFAVAQGRILAAVNESSAAPVGRPWACPTLEATRG